MTAITAFPEIYDTQHGAFGTEMSYEADGDILAGQIVQLQADGTVKVGTASSQKIIGVALTDIADGFVGAIRVCGVARVANAASDTAITAGSPITASTLGAAAVATTGSILGVALEPIAKGGTGLVLVSSYTNTTA